MIAVNFSTARSRLKDFCDKVTDEAETVIVTRKAEKNVVIISAKRYSELEKAERNAEYLRKLDRERGMSAYGRGRRAGQPPGVVREEAADDGRAGGNGGRWRIESPFRRTAGPTICIGRPRIKRRCGASISCSRIFSATGRIRASASRSPCAM